MQNRDVIISEINNLWQKTEWQNRFSVAKDILHSNDTLFTTSLSLEDQVITFLAVQSKVDLRFATLDTGRQFEEIYTTHAKTEEKYAIKIHSFYPETKDIEEYVRLYGINAFYHSKDLRHECCRIRKVEPLKRALAGANFWISGLRQQQSDSRASLPFAQWDASNNVIKLHPLADVTEEQIWDCIRTNDIPYNIMSEKGYPSIGCSPCTRAVKEGEHSRAGRWWWEQGNQECGLHFENGQAVRIKQ